MNIAHSNLILIVVSSFNIDLIKFLIVESLGCVVHCLVGVELRCLILFKCVILIYIFKYISLLMCADWFVFISIWLYNWGVLNIFSDLWNSAVVARIYWFLKNGLLLQLFLSKVFFQIFILIYVFEKFCFNTFICIYKIIK